jgi:hypothetical protein
VSKPGRKDFVPEDATKKSISHMRKYGGEAPFPEEARKRRFSCLTTCGRETFFL